MQPLSQNLLIDVFKALGAGLISFLSPCVLPLVPGYLSFVSGASLDEMRAGGKVTWRVAWRSLAFIMGFTLVFVALGATATTVGTFLRERLETILRIAGIVLIVFGLHMVGILRIGFLLREKRFQPRARPVSFVGAALVGIAFAFGWSPCIGPLLTAILALASKQESVVRGMVLLLAYSAGLGIPLFLAAVATERFLSATATVRSRFHLVEIVGGIVLVAIGIAMVAGRFGEWSGRISSIAAGNEIVSALLTALVLYYVAGLALTVWVTGDARRRNKKPLPWSAAALLAGPLGALAYRLTRR